MIREIYTLINRIQIRYLFLLQFFITKVLHSSGKKIFKNWYLKTYVKIIKYFEKVQLISITSHSIYSLIKRINKSAYKIINYFYIHILQKLTDHTAKDKIKFTYHKMKTNFGYSVNTKIIIITRTENKTVIHLEISFSTIYFHYLNYSYFLIKSKKFFRKVAIQYVTILPVLYIFLQKL